jgi:predicted HNH restriction endonuclease
MTEWTWQQAVAERVIALVEQRESTEFRLDDAYSFEAALRTLFPGNRHVREKIRQTLQRLRDDGLLIFLGQGRYRLNVGHEEIAAEYSESSDGVISPETKLRLRNIRLRDTVLAAHIKRRYRYTCQVCRRSLLLPENKRYAEAHHLHPLGAPHYGPDTSGNIIVVCPNHHVLFDKGAISVVPDTLVVLQPREHSRRSPQKLFVADWHHLARIHLEYHHQRIFRAA